MKEFMSRLPYISSLHKQINDLKAELVQWRTWRPPGHFYSPIPSLDEIRKRENAIFHKAHESLAGVDLNESGQLRLLDTLCPYYGEQNLPAVATKGFRYYYENEYFSYADGITLHCMLRHLRPNKVIEVGSGYSSALMLDTNDRFLDNKTQFIFIEPYPKRLETLIWDADEAKTTIIRKQVQETPIALFKDLRAGDILFIDSSHVSKTGSDVNYLLFDVLPALSSGVYIHFHDIFYPFEYPKNWIYEGVAWNEAYVLRAFLQYNAKFTIEFFVSFIMSIHKQRVAEAMPLALLSEKDNISLYSDAPGGSIWLRKK